MKGQRHRWYAPELERERARAVLEARADELLAAADRRRRRPVASRKPPAPALPTQGWAPLADLKKVLRRQGKE